MGSACSTREIALKKIEPAPRSGEGGGIRRLFYVVRPEDSIYQNTSWLRYLPKASMRGDMPSKEKLRKLVSSTNPLRKGFSLLLPHSLQKAGTGLLVPGRRIEGMLHICIF